MKTIKLTMIATFAVLTFGCAINQKLPSVTLGGAANKNAVLGLTVSKEAVGVTAPLVDVKVPLPDLEVDE